MSNERPGPVHGRSVPGLQARNFPLCSPEQMVGTSFPQQRLHMPMTESRHVIAQYSPGLMMHSSICT